MFWSIANWGLDPRASRLSPQRLGNIYTKHHLPDLILTPYCHLPTHLFSRLGARGGDNVPFKYIFMKVRLKTLNANSTRRHAARPLRPLLIRDIEVKGRVDQPRRKVYGKLGDGATALH